MPSHQVKMDPQNSFRLSFKKYTRLNTWNYCFLIVFVFVMCARVTYSKSPSVHKVRDPFKGMPQSPITRIHRVSNGRLNSRYLQTFPPLEFLQFARREGISHPHDIRNGNSPVFYIRLPPAPYILVPGLGYVSPHPYNTPLLPPNPVMMNPLGMMMSGLEPEDLSTENSQNNVISLPLKFLSNGRPAQIKNPKKSQSKMNTVSSDSSKSTNLISGGKYSFNGRPNGVFIVRSPIDQSQNNL